jgi:hypothetical protein
MAGNLSVCDARTGNDERSEPGEVVLVEDVTAAVSEVSELFLALRRYPRSLAIPNFYLSKC